LAGCIAQASAQMQTAINPPATGGGTLSCRQVMEQCDAQCGDPLCVRRCGDQGTPDAARQHDAVVDCGMRNHCTDEPCMRASCNVEVEACYGEALPPPGGEPPTNDPPPPPADEPPG
jgi:hypothetical protein